MFEVKQHAACAYYIVNKECNHLHSDGSIYGTAEYFPSAKIAQAILDKFQHEWKHGDVFKNCAGIYIYLEPHGGPIVVNLEYTNRGGTPDVQLPDSKFLFNIKEKI